MHSLASRAEAELVLSFLLLVHALDTLEDVAGTRLIVAADSS